MIKSIKNKIKKQPTLKKEGMMSTTSTLASDLIVVRFMWMVPGIVPRNEDNTRRETIWVFSSN